MNEPVCPRCGAILRYPSVMVHYGDKGGLRELCNFECGNQTLDGARLQPTTECRLRQIEQKLNRLEERCFPDP